MENSKLIKLLQSLNQYEIRQFGDFVNSPSFSKKIALPKLFDELKKNHPDYKDIDEKEIFSNVYHGEKFDYNKFKNTISDLYNLGKEFLAFLKYRKDNQTKEKYLLEELRMRRLNTHFEQELKTAYSGLKKCKIEDDVFIMHKFILKTEEMSYLVPQKPNEYIHLQQELFELFLTYSLIKILKSYNVMMHEEKQNNLKYNLYLIDQVISFLEKNKFNNPTLIVYYHIIKLLKNNNDDNFRLLKKAADKYRDGLNESDRYMVFLHLTGYCMNEYNINCRTDLMHEHFELVKQKNGWKMMPKILYPDFLNEVKIAARVNELEWAERYIEMNEYILVEGREDTLNFCKGLIQYKKGNNEKALELLSRTNFRNFILKLQVKTLELQIFFETNNFDQTISAIDNFRHYIKREKTIKDDFKKMFIKFLNITGKLVKLKNGDFDKEKKFYMNKIKKEISEMEGNQFGIKLWLMGIQEA
jgi:hypothetical protein